MNPEYHTLAGSGLRAAATLADSGTDVHLYSATHRREREVAQITAATLGVAADWTDRTRSVGFSYFTPLGAPLINGAGTAIADEISVEDDTVLVFGMIEAGRVSAKGRRVVVDPQRPRGLNDDDLPFVTADEVAWTLNERETKQLAEESDVKVGAKALLDKFGLTAVITKRGPRGALVTTANYQEEVGAYQTSSVFPIGSGDVFAAAFAFAWGHAKHDPVAAARIASAAAAHWCETTDYPTPRQVLGGAAARRVVPPDTTSKVYLAGPFFNLQQRWLVDVARDSLAPGVWSPFHEVGPGGIEVAQKDLDGLNQCDALLALIDDDDPGTIFEAGYATNMGIPIVGYGEQGNADGRKMLLGSGASLYTDLSTAVYQAVWAAARNADERRSTGRRSG
ncbi:PfkB family carbohydrate kinase [Nocardioides sp.]|uniref:PfkB family carbohydrate kinase n=1 Tax=Nocardioides sp. TaxID=35761 RepID=UPI002601EB62|nr:PfkB family carbohydrate kinase [Nocardioides sp.]